MHMRLVRSRPTPCRPTLRSPAPLQSAAAVASHYTVRGGKSDIVLDWFAHHFFEPGVRLTLTAAGLVLCLGVLLTSINTFLFFVNKLTGKKFRMVMDFFPCDGRQPVQLTRVKLQLGYTASVALQMLVIADILDSLVKPAFAFTLIELCKLGSIVGIRTALAFFLNAETREAEEEVRSTLTHMGPHDMVAHHDATLASGMMTRALCCSCHSRAQLESSEAENVTI